MLGEEGKFMTNLRRVQVRTPERRKSPAPFRPIGTFFFLSDLLLLSGLLPPAAKSSQSLRNKRFTAGCGGLLPCSLKVEIRQGDNVGFPHAWRGVAFKYILEGRLERGRRFHSTKGGRGTEQNLSGR